MNIAVTGYCGTGSSAVVDLLLEYDNCTKGKLQHYEHIPFYTPNGLFDLEDKLLIGNNLHRSDEAIESFIREMTRLSHNDFGWFGAYNKNYGNKFNSICYEFIDNITQYCFEGKWSYDFIGCKFSFYQYIKDIVKFLIRKDNVVKKGRKIAFNNDNLLKCSFITEEEFYKEARIFVKNYIDMINDRREDNIIFDHLLLPHNLFRVPNYFDEDFRVIVVDRDVRDMYVLSKYVWPSMGLSAPFPKEPKEFVEFWKRMRNCEKKIEDYRILRVKFEDLVYNYDETVKEIEEFLELKEYNHKNKKGNFIPEKSIKNTQNFLIKEEWKDEIKYIEENLKEYIYDFPYNIETSLNETFDI